MLKLAAAFFGNVTLAWVAGVVGLILFVHAALDRRRVRRQARQMAEAQEKLSDGLWEVRAAGEARAKAEASTRAKSRLLATVSHEVRTPLNGILGMAELLGATALDPEQQAYVDAIHASGRALTALIDEVLDLARIESGKLALVSEPFDLAGLVEGVVELLGPRAQEKDLEIASLIDPGLPAIVLGDAARLRQVLINLAGNAVKFTDYGGVGVRLAAGPDGTITVTVTDTGPGVPPERRAAIFEEFEQGGAETARRHGGTGLGLTITRHLVGLMGGRLTLADNPGGGSSFGFTVRLEAASDGQAAAATLPDLGGTTALIVANSPFQAPYLAQRLSGAGAKAVLVPSVEEALSLLRDSQKRFGLLLVDCALGQAGVNALADAALAAQVERSFLLFSPSERRAFGQKMIDSFDGWLVKPVRARSLATRLGPAPMLPATVKAADPLPASVDPMHILLAEDNEINTLVMLKMLDKIGAQVTHVADGAVALTAALAAMRGETRAFDTILLDISMPGLDGQEAARLLRRAEKGEGATPTRIVALTAFAFEDDRQACFEAGIDEFLTKPIDLARLRAALRPEAGEPEAPPAGTKAAV